MNDQAADTIDTKAHGFFSAAYVINLDADTERMSRISERFERLGLNVERFSAVAIHETALANSSPLFTPGYWACAASHKALLEKIYDAGHETALILEDDVVFRDDAMGWLEKLRPQWESIEWDILHLGLELIESGGWVSDNLGRVKRGFHSHAYAVHRRALPRLIAHIGRAIANPIAAFDAFDDPGLVRLYTIPILAIQEPAYSHTHGRVIDRTEQYFRFFDRHDFERNCTEMRGWKLPAGDAEGNRSPDPFGSWPAAALTKLAMDRHKAGALREAEALYERALGLEPRNGQALHYSGLLLNQLKKFAEGIDRLKRALIEGPESAEFHNNFAVVLAEHGRTAEALDLLDEAVRLRPEYAEAHVNRGAMLEKLGRRDEAMAAWERTISLQPDHAGAHRRLGDAHLREKRWELALKHLSEAVRLEPGRSEVRLNLGNALRESGDLRGAAAAYREVTQQRAGWSDGHSNLGAVLHQLGEFDDAVVSLRRAVEARPEAIDAHWNLALALLTTGDYQRGWVEYEWRRRLREDRPHHRNLPHPEWNGCDVAGRTVLVLAEQGLGDTLQFARYLPPIKGRGARVIFECQPPLKPLLSNLEGVDAIVARGEPLPAFDVQVRLMSLPGLFGTRVETIPANVPYLRADAERVARWSHLRSGDGELHVGIAWKGSDVYRNDRYRSAPLKHFAPLARVPGVRLYALQKGTALQQKDEVDFMVHDIDRPFDEGCGAFLDTAAIMMNLDLVVSSDTSMVHLAGALGVPVWMATSFSPDWRWLLHRDDSPWYPTMRLFRQKTLGDWDGVFAAMAEQIAEIKPGLGETSLWASPLLAQISPGSLIDRITILQIKSERLKDPAKLAHVEAELAALGAARAGIPSLAQVSDLQRQLRETNETLWECEDEIRLREKASDFGEEFVAVARRVYQTNDRRCDLKRQLDGLLQSKIIDQRLYSTAT